MPRRRGFERIACLVSGLSGAGCVRRGRPIVCGCAAAPARMRAAAASAMRHAGAAACAAIRSTVAAIVSDP